MLPEHEWCASRDSNPEKSRGLSPPHVPLLLQAHFGTSGGIRTLNSCILSAVPIPYSATKVCWYPRSDSNRDLYGSEPFACTCFATRIFGDASGVRTLISELRIRFPILLEESAFWSRVRDLNPANTDLKGRRVNHFSNARTLELKMLRY